MFSSLLITIGILVSIPGSFIFFYNNLIGRKNQVDQAFSSIDVLLKKRWDLIPNLVAVVKNYADFEQKTLTDIARLRSQAMSSRDPGGERVEVENQISRAIGNILVAIESYPELKANNNFISLQATLNETEEQLSAARRFYNASVTDYNNAIEMFPTNLIASQLRYQLKQLFEIVPQERQNVDVGNLFNQ
jgi:LemA protein